MPRKKSAAELVEEFAPPTKEDLDLETFLEEVGPGTSLIEVYRMQKDGSRPHVDRVALDVLKEDLYGYIREHYGAGKYLLQFKGADRRIQTTKVVDVADNKITGAPVVNGNGHSSSDSRFHQELILALITASKPPPPLDVGTLLTGLAAMRPPAPPDPTTMLAGVIAAFTALKGSNGSENELEKFKNMVSLVKDLMPEAKGEENLYTVAKDVGTKLIDAIKPRQLSGAVEPIPTATGLQEASVQPAALPAPDPFTVTEDTLQQWIKNQLAYLKMKAKADKDPAAWVDYIFENDDEPGCHAVLIAMERGVTFDMLCDFDAEIKSNPQLNSWFRKLYDGLHAELHPSVDTAGGAGDMGDLASNAATVTANDDTRPTAGAPARKSRKRQ